MSATSFVTTEPAPTIEFSPIVIPGNTVALAPMLAPFLIVIPRNLSGYCFDRGITSLVNVTFGPINTLSSIRVPSHT
ncbi:hypothetical protein QWZ13_10295 [Reinekea marina]|nr:hypothetical protein [Reinekea marina]MDN3649303.1 hypothetical protein [Reinekea marina]